MIDVCGNMGSIGTGKATSGKKDYNSNGDYIKKIDISKYHVDYGDLPELIGSEKQKAWAEKIREENINVLEKELLRQADDYNEIIDRRTRVLSEGKDISNWAKITKSEYENNIERIKTEKDTAHDMAIKSIAEFYRENPKASTVIDTRQSVPKKSLVKFFRDNPSQAKENYGVAYIIRHLGREGYNVTELKENWKKKYPNGLK